MNQFSATDDLSRLLTPVFHEGGQQASDVLTRWLSKPTKITLEAVTVCPLSNVTQALPASGPPICACVMPMHGWLHGLMLFACDDRDGLSISDMVLQRPAGSTTEWDEVAQSAVLETMNIAGSAYLNGITAGIARHLDHSSELMPAPPVFMRDFAESLLQSAFLDQAMSGTMAVYAQAQFHVEGRTHNWTLLVIPDAESLKRLIDAVAGQSPLQADSNAS